MKRLIMSSNKSGRESHGSKWQTTQPTTDSDSETDDQNQQAHDDDDDELHSAHDYYYDDDGDELHSAPVGSNESATIDAAEVQPTILQGNYSRRISPDGETMYRAAIQGDWLAAEVLLSRNPSLATDCLTAEGDRALHVAAAMKRENFVKKLVERMKEEDDLLLRDGHGCTACCYAALSGVQQIAGVMVEIKPEVVTMYDDNNLTPIHKAALRGNKKVLSYLLKLSKVEDLSNDAWFDILLLTIQAKMFDVGIELVEKINVLATMAREERTALHLLAQLEMPYVRGWRGVLQHLIFGIDFTELPGARPPSFVKLCKKLWGEMQKMGNTSLLEVIRKRPHILHDAVKAGHVELVAMLLRSYPQLVLDTDGDGYTIFHIAVAYRQHAFSLMHQVKAMIHTRIISRDKDGNNILHLAAKLCAGSLNRGESAPHMLFREDLRWFYMTKRAVPASYQDMRNNEGLTPRDLFSKTHRRMLNDGKTWMINSADSNMLIATILLSIVFAAAFTVPGGYDNQTGKPVLFAKNSFKDFIGYELYGVTGSVVSILFFRSIMTSRFEEDDFLVELPFKMIIGFYLMFLSLMLAIGAFMSSFELVGWTSNHGNVLYTACVIWFFREFAKIVRSDLICVVRSVWKSPFSVYNQQPTATGTYTKIGKLFHFITDRST